MVYNVIRSKRKTIAIKITTDCKVCVYAPNSCSLNTIEGFIKLKQSWITEKLKFQQENHIKLQKFLTYESVMIFGDSLDICDKRNHYLIGDYYIKHTNSNNKIKALKDFLKKLANNYILSRVNYLAEKLNYKFSDTKIVSSRHYWGSCNSKKQLKFNFRCIMIPKELIDYVICHELCHLKEMNHGKKFWNLLNELGYKKTDIKQKFKDFGFVLQLF